MRQKQPEPELLDAKKGFKCRNRKAYREEDKIIVEQAGEIIATEEIEKPERDFSATLYNIVKA